MEATTAKDEGIHIISIGVGGWLDKAELNNMVSYPKDQNMFLVPNYESLDNIVENIINAFNPESKNLDLYKPLGSIVLFHPPLEKM